MRDYQEFLQGSYEGLSALLAWSFIWYPVGACIRWCREYLTNP